MSINPKKVIDYFPVNDVVCFSHLRWNFVYQRPQHLLSRFAKHTRVFYFEEPMFYDGEAKLEITKYESGKLYRLVPYLKHGLSKQQVNKLLAEMVLECIDTYDIHKYCAWYYTPMALAFTESISPTMVVFDCMDELSAFKFAPPEIKQREQQLLQKADIVFTGGYSIYEAKKRAHKNIYPFPSSIDKIHFNQARNISIDPPDQQHIPHPRFGFFGVVDERFNLQLIKDVATEKPNWHFVIVGPVVKIEASSLPQLPNIHYLGSKDYKELPHYLAGWDIATIPFALNESTQFISPTKTPEYLAGGKPVISTPIKDVVDPYGKNNLVHIACTPQCFIAAASQELSCANKQQWLTRADTFLKDISWDNTWMQMAALITKTWKEKYIIEPLKQEVYV